MDSEIQDLLSALRQALREGDRDGGQESCLRTHLSPLLLAIRDHGDGFDPDATEEDWKQVVDYTIARVHGRTKAEKSRRDVLADDGVGLPFAEDIIEKAKLWLMAQVAARSAVSQPCERSDDAIAVAYARASELVAGHQDALGPFLRATARVVRKELENNKDCPMGALSDRDLIEVVRVPLLRIHRDVTKEAARAKAGRSTASTPGSASPHLTHKSFVSALQKAVGWAADWAAVWVAAMGDTPDTKAIEVLKRATERLLETKYGARIRHHAPDVGDVFEEARQHVWVKIAAKKRSNDPNWHGPEHLMNWALKVAGRYCRGWLLQQLPHVEDPGAVPAPGREPVGAFTARTRAWIAKLGERDRELIELLDDEGRSEEEAQDELGYPTHGALKQAYLRAHRRLIALTLSDRAEDGMACLNGFVKKAGGDEPGGPVPIADHRRIRDDLRFIKYGLDYSYEEDGVRKSATQRVLEDCLKGRGVEARGRRKDHRGQAKTLSGIVAVMLRRLLEEALRSAAVGLDGELARHLREGLGVILFFLLTFLVEKPHRVKRSSAQRSREIVKGWLRRGELEACLVQAERELNAAAARDQDLPGLITCVSRWCEDPPGAEVHPEWVFWTVCLDRCQTQNEER